MSTSRYLVTGMAGGLAQLVAEKLLARGHEVVGVDYRPTPKLDAALAKMPIHRASYNKTAIEDLFRKYRLTGVLHLGRVGNLKESAGKRFDLNVVGSQKILNLCVSNGVRDLLVLSTFHIYGAHPHNHIPIAEEEPLRAGFDFPQLADAIQLDSMASTWVWRHPEVRTVVLRPTNVVGPTINNTMSKFLRLERVPHVMGFNPMMQFVHEDDLAEAIVAAALGEARGIYNVAGPSVIPWRTAIEIAGARSVPIPSSLASAYVRMFSGFPEYLINFFRYPCVVSDALFRRVFDWEPKVPIRDTIWSAVEDARRAQALARR